MSWKKTIHKFAVAGVSLGLGVTSGAQLSPTHPGINDALKERTSTFIQNRGQWDSRALFWTHSPGVDVWVTKEGITYQYLARPGDRSTGYAGHTVGMIFDGANAFTASAENQKGTRDFISASGTVSSRTFERVRLQNVYDKIDVVTFKQDKAPRYDFVVKPGGEVADIRLQFKGAAGVKLASPSKLCIQTVLGERYHQGLKAYQTIDGKKVSVPVRFTEVRPGLIGFAVGKYDKSKALIIDPLVYGTYYGGDNGFDEVRGVAADSNGNVFITGYTKSNIYPVLYGPFGFNRAGGREAFFSRLQGDAYVHDYSALISGAGDDQGNFVQLDPFGNPWVVGSTTSSTFPPSGSSPSPNDGNIWILRFKPSAISVMTPLEAGLPVLFRFGGNVTSPVVTAITTFSIRPETNPVPGAPVRMMVTGYCTPGVAVPGITALGAAGNQGVFHATLEWTASGGFTQIGGGATNYINFNAPATGLTLTGAAYDAGGNFFLSGTLVAPGNSDTGSGSFVFETTTGIFENGRLQRQRDIWVRKYVPSGLLAWSGLLGGSSNDVTEGFFPTAVIGVNEVAGSTLAVDPQGNAYVLGRSQSFDFPRTRNVFGEIFQSGENYVTVTKISANGSAIIYSTNIRNRGVMTGSGIAVDPRGNAYLTGQVSVTSNPQVPPGDPAEVASHNDTSKGFIPTKNPLRAEYTYPAAPIARTFDGWFMVLNSNATDTILATYIGGVLDDGIFAPYVDRGGDVWVFGWSDTVRNYRRISSSGTVNNRSIPSPNLGVSGLDPVFITNLAFKQGKDPGGNNNENISGVYYWTTPFGDVAIPGPVSFARDGFLLRFREGLPLISSLTLNPTIAPGGDPNSAGNPASTTGTVVLSAPAPVGGATIELSITDGTIASFLATSNTTTSTVTIPEGQTTATFTVFTRPVLDAVNVSVRADYSGNVKIAQLTVIPWNSSLSLATSNVVGGNGLTGVVTLSAPAPTGGAILALGTDRPDLVSFVDADGNPVTTVEVGAGQTQATFQLTTNGVNANTAVQIQSSLLGVTRSQTLNIVPAKLNRIILDPASISMLASTTGRVVLDGKAASALTIELGIQGSPAGYVLSSPTVTVPAGASESEPFTITAPYEGADRTRIVTALRRSTPGGAIVDGPVTGTLTVFGNSMTDFRVDPTIVASGGITTGTIRLNRAAPAGGVPVLVSSSNPALLTPVTASGVPTTTVVVPEGLVEVDFPVKANFAINGDEVAILSAYLGPAPFNGSFQRQATVTVTALTYDISIAPNDVVGGQSAVGTITLSGAAPAGFSMLVTCNDPSISFDQPVFLTGATSAQFAIRTSEIADTTTVLFTTQAGTLPAVSAPLTIRGNEIVGLRILPRNRVRQGTTVTFEVSAARAVSAPRSGVIRFSNPSLLELPAGQTTLSFTIAPGQRVANVSVRTRRVTRLLSTSVTASFGTAPDAPSASATLFVDR